MDLGDAKIVQRAQLLWCNRIIVGEMRREYYDIRSLIVIDLDKRGVDLAIKAGEGDERLQRNLYTLIPGYDIVERGYRTLYKHPPCIVEMRVPDRRRTDIGELTRAVGLEIYDEFSYFLKIRGRGLDEWTVREIPLDYPLFPNDEGYELYVK